jgi:hypothetical protein
MIPLILGAVAAATAVRGVFFGYPEKAVHPGTLSAKEQAIIAACADAFFPPSGPIPISGTRAGLIAYFDEYVQRLPKEQAFLVRLLIWFFEHGPWIFGPRPVRFTRLSHEDRLRVLASMQTSPIYFRRVSFLSMRTILSMGYLAHPEVMAAMHLKHDADPFGMNRRPTTLAAEVA